MILRLLLLLALIPGMALAQAAAPGDSELRPLVTADETRGWEAVGRIDLGGTAFCTGALIAPDLVLTAAHCLIEKDSGKPYDAGAIRFLAGWRNGRAVAYRGVRRAIAHPLYDYNASDKMVRVAYDLALLQLDQPIRLPSVRPFQTTADPGTGDRLEVVSYALDRSEAPSLQDSCEVLGREPGVLILSCQVDFGSSGAPIFMVADGKPEIVSVVSAKAEMESRVVALASAAEGPMAELRSALADAESEPQPAQGVRRVVVGDSRLNGGGGAKFLRP